MKLRIKGNSLRLRLSQSDVARLVQSGEIEETVYFTAEPDAKLTYALKVAPSSEALSVSYAAQRVAVSINAETAERWTSQDTEVGIYGSIDTGHGPLELLIEKDFACLDATEEENQDTFPNPIACQPVAK